MNKALLTGTFDPPTKGHLRLIRRAAPLFNTFVVGIGENSQKRAPLLTPSERLEALCQELSPLSNVEVVTFEGLTLDFAKHIHATVLIRGLRSTADFDYEMQMALANQKLGGIETFFLMAEQPEISSSLIRELGIHGAPLETILPRNIIQLFQHRIQKRN